MALFLKAILLPVFFAFVAAALEATSSLVKGLSDGENKFKVWLDEIQARGSHHETAKQNLSIEDIRELDNVIDIEPMASFDYPQFAPVGIDLMVGALCIDVIALIDINGNIKSGGWAVVLGHIFMLVGVIFYYNKNLAVSPKKVKEKEYYSKLAIALGIAAMMSAFFMA